VEGLKNFLLECLREPWLPLSETPTSPSGPTGPLGLRLVYFPLTNIVVSVRGRRVPSQRRGSAVYSCMAACLAASSATLFPLLPYLSLFGDLYNESWIPLKVIEQHLGGLVCLEYV
jgi:hypothetical protein